MSKHKRKKERKKESEVQTKGDPKVFLSSL